MNKKLVRLEYKETRKAMLIITALIAVYMLITTICNACANLSTTYTGFTYAAFTGKAILIIISTLLIIGAGVMMVKRYYNLLFSNEGYSRLSFPVSNSAHLNANLKCAFIWLGLQALVFEIGLSISDIFSKHAFDRYGIGNLYPDYLRNYRMISLGKYMACPELKALLTIILLIIAFIIIAANIYLSFIFTLTISNYLCGKHNVVQKNAVILITGILLFNVHLIVANLLNNFIEAFRDRYYNFNGYELFGPNILFIDEAVKPVTYILFYGITGFVMYRISRSILDKKLDI